MSQDATALLLGIAIGVLIVLLITRQPMVAPQALTLQRNDAGRLQAVRLD